MPPIVSQATGSINSHVSLGMQQAPFTIDSQTDPQRSIIIRISETSTSPSPSRSPAQSPVQVPYSESKAKRSTTSTVPVDVEETGHAAFARLGAGEWMFIPFCHHGGDVGIQFQVAHASEVLMEYGYWTKG